jgi:outer membrane protein TolC
MVIYYDILRQQNYLKIIENTLDVSKQKLDIINVKNNIGMADAADLLQAKSDVNSAEQLLELQKMVIEQTKSDLLLQITAKKQNPFSVSDTIIVDQSLQLDTVLNYLNRNPQYLSAEQQILINEQYVKEVSAQRYPSIKASAGYDFYQANTNKGNLQLNQNYGPTAGITMQVPIFNGNIYKTQTAVAKINVDNSKLERENLLNSLSTQAIKLYRSYTTTIQQIESQRSNFEMNKQLVNVVLQKFKLGQATILDVKAAQTSFETAAYLLVNLLYSAKVSEIELKQLTYSLKY